MFCLLSCLFAGKERRKYKQESMKNILCCLKDEKYGNKNRKACSSRGTRLINYTYVPNSSIKYI